MTAPRGILEINEGRPFGWIERLEFGRHGYGTCMYVYAACAALVRYQAEAGSGRFDSEFNGERGMEATIFETPRGGWGKFLGIGERTAWRYLADLEREGFIEKWASEPGRRTTWALSTSPLEKREEGKLGLRVELAPMGDPEWTDGTRAVWIACRRRDLRAPRCRYPLNGQRRDHRFQGNED